MLKNLFDGGVEFLFREAALHVIEQPTANNHVSIDVALGWVQPVDAHRVVSGFQAHGKAAVVASVLLPFKQLKEVISIDRARHIELPRVPDDPADEVRKPGSEITSISAARTCPIAGDTIGAKARSRVVLPAITKLFNGKIAPAAVAELSQRHHVGFLAMPKLATNTTPTPHDGFVVFGTVPDMSTDGASFLMAGSIGIHAPIISLGDRKVS